MINVSQAFHRTSANPIDETLALTKAQMLATNDNLMPSKYMTVCQDDGAIYLYDKSNTPDVATGKFRKFEGGGGGGTAGSVYTATLLVNGWNGSNQQTLTFTGYSADYHGVVGVPADATSAQLDEYKECAIRTVSQSGATVTFECETVPSIDLPVEIYCGGGSGSGGGAEAFIITVTMNGSNLVADKTPKELEDALASNAIAKVKLPMYGLVLDLSVASGGNFAFSTFYTEDATDPSTTAFGTILMVKDTDSAWDSITMQTFQGDKFSKEVKCGADLFDQPAIYLNDFDHEEDTTNHEDIVSPHRLTSAEMTEIMSTLPGAPTELPVYSTTEQVVGIWTDGKTIYRRILTMTFGTVTEGTWSDVACSQTIPNLETMVSFEAVSQLSGIQFVLPWIFNNGTQVKACYDINQSTARMSTNNADMSNKSVRVIIQYTKTTD